MIVIKLGGSLLSDKTALKQCLTTIASSHHTKIVIVPGGGVFADQVRVAQQQWQFDDVTAHQMAILAMQQMALLLNSIKPEFLLTDKIVDINNTSLVTIWSPDKAELDNVGIKASWDISSDSLAAWLANQLLAQELILVKSAAIPDTASIDEMQQLNLVDKAFKQYTQATTYKITLLNKYGFNERAFT